MSPVDFAIRNPVTVIVGAILLALFGYLAAVSLPVQLTPDVDLPIITVTTLWEGASPQEVEREIVDEQEERLNGIPGLRRMKSTAIQGLATVELEFQVGVDISRALLEVNDKLRQVPSYPENVDEPVITVGETSGANSIAWFILEAKEDSKVDPDSLPLLRTLMEQRVKPILERARGVSSIAIVGGQEREIHVQVDPVRLSARQLSLLDVRSAIRTRNRDISAGNLELGKQSFTVRTVGKFKTLKEIEDLVLARRRGRIVRLRDVGTVTHGFKEPMIIVRSNGAPSIAVNALRQSGSNVLEVMDGLRKALEEANRTVLEERGLHLTQVYDQTTYIYSAIDLVEQNLYVGGLLALGVLLLFLRSARSTLVVGLAIPISVVGSFIALRLLGRNLNVVSLAGLAFAIGMVVDNSIVVLENIYRHRQTGKSPFEAARDGAREVWGAVLASTLTTLAVFLPVLFIEEETGQLFRDIAIAISAAVAVSLLVSIFFIPMAAARLVQRGGPSDPTERRNRLVDILLLGPAGRLFTDLVTGTVAWLNRGVVRRLASVILITGSALFLSWALIPPMTYLPQGNQNLVIGFLIPPPGYNNDEFIRLGKQVESALEPYFVSRAGKSLPHELQFPDWYKGDKPLPTIPNFFYVAFGESVFMGAASSDPTNVKSLEQLFQHAYVNLPDVFGFAFQTSLFERGITSGNSIDLEITGNDMPSVSAAAGMLFGSILERLGPPRPEPANFNLGAPEYRVQVDEVRAAEVGVSVQDLGFMVQCMIDGAVVSEFEHEGDLIDIKLVHAGGANGDIQRIEDLPIFTRAGRQIPLSSVATVEEATAPNEILHLQERRAVKLIVTPPEGMALSEAMEILQDEIIEPMRARGELPPGVTTALAGTADKLVSTRDALQANFLLAIIITYLLLAALFESFLYPVVIMITVPLAAVGGIAGLWLVHDLTGQQMDVLTMLGFVILVGTVVNNAILIVHYALGLIRREGIEPQDAIVMSVRARVRPIFMSTSTSVLGMLPLVLFPGAGSELYRGLGSVVVGGLIASTVFTLLVVPTLFSLCLGSQQQVKAAARAITRTFTRA